MISLSRVPLIAHPVDRGIGDRGRVGDILEGDVLARHHAGPPAKARRQRDLGISLLQQGLADQVVERAVEIAAPVQQRFRAPERAAKVCNERLAHLRDLRCHRGVGRDHIREQRDQLVSIGLDLAVLHVEIEARHELA